MSNSRLLATIGMEPHTSLDEAVRATLIGVGCLGTNEAPPPPFRLASRSRERLARDFDATIESATASPPRSHQTAIQEARKNKPDF